MNDCLVMTHRMFRRCRFHCAAMTLLLAGCNASRSADYNDVELIDVTGRVTLDGVALNKARVSFESPDQTSSSGVTNKQGEYRLMFDSEKRGCQPGEKIVRITMFAGDDEEDPDADDTSGIVIPALYHTNSTLRAVVADDATRFDFDLTSDDEPPTE